MSAHSDSPSGKQYHVRYRVTSHGPDSGPLWTYVTDDEADARQVLAVFQREDGVTDAQLWTRDITNWQPL